MWMGLALRRRSRWLVVPLVVGIYLLAATAPAWWGGGAITPRTQNVLLGDRIRLVGSYVPKTRVAPGERELMEDWYFVDIPPDLAPGRYVFLTGMYDPKTVRNLPVQGGELLGGRIVVGEIEVTR